MFRCYRQLEHSDCGLTCIRMVARHYGLKISIRQLHKMTDLNRLGMSLKDIALCLEQLGFETAGVNITPQQIQSMPLPAIIYWQQRHFVVLYKVSHNNRTFHIADPAQGKLRYSEADFMKYWIGYQGKCGLAIVVDPKVDFQPQKLDIDQAPKRFFTYLLGFLKSHKANYLRVLVITLAIMAADFAIPLLLRRTIDEGIGMRNVPLVGVLLLGQLCIALGGLMSAGIMDILLTRTGVKMTLDMSNSFLERLARFPLSFFDRKVSSDFIQKINDQERIKTFLLSCPNSMIILSLTFAVFSALLCHYNVTIFVVFITLSIMEIAWNLLFLNQRKTIDYAKFTNVSESRNLTYELTNGMADLKVHNAERSRINKWRQLQERLNNITMRSARLKLIQGGGHSTISHIKDLVVTGLGATMVIWGDMSMGILMTLSYITGRLSQPFNEIVATLNSMQDAFLSYQRIDEVICDDSDPRGEQPYKTPNMTFTNVWFKYPGSSSPFVIRDMTLKIQRGTTVALVGESGCGKSTLIKLMLGFYVPQRGKLILSELPVESLSHQQWLRHCGVVMQDGKVFSGSVLENIAMADETPDTAKVSHLLELVGLQDFIHSLPMGVYTNLGVAGISMSGGQQQRLMIARALYKDPDILFLDEATSSLDANNERRIVENIKDYCRDKTLIIAAHRLSTIQDADRILYLQDGTIKEAGTHAELIARKGLYWHLVRNQMPLPS